MDSNIQWKNDETGAACWAIDWCGNHILLDRHNYFENNEDFKEWMIFTNELYNGLVKAA